MAECHLSQWRRQFLYVTPELKDQIKDYLNKEINLPDEKITHNDSKRINDLERKVRQLEKEREMVF